MFKNLNILGIYTGKRGSSLLLNLGFLPPELGISSLIMTIGVVSDSGSNKTENEENLFRKNKVM
jgi:hypothetical protein